MAIITISRGCFSKGREVAEAVAKQLGYQCIGRELLLEASREFNIPEIRLESAIHDAPSVLDRFTTGRERYIAYFQSAFLKHMRRDNVVYHGLAGHFFLKGVAHTLKVRITASMADRVRWEMEKGREGSAQDCQELLKKDDLERSKWSKSLYGIDTAEATLYDLVIRIGRITVPEAVDIICAAASGDNLKTTYESQKAIENLSLAADVKAALIDIKPDIQVNVQNGKVIIGSSNLQINNPGMADDIAAIARKIPGVQSVDVRSDRLVDWTD